MVPAKVNQACNKIITDQQTKHRHYITDGDPAQCKQVENPDTKIRLTVK